MRKLAVLLFALFFAGYASAEFIYLKSGEEVNGKIISETNDSVTVKVSGKNRKIYFKDINEISSKRKEVAQNVAPVSAEEAKTQFTSTAKQELEDADTYVNDNQSGIIVYSVKETPITALAAVPAQAISSSDNSEFDAAAYLLDGGEPGKAVQGKIATTPQSVTDDDEQFDAAAYLLGGGESGKAIKGASSSKKEKAKPVKVSKDEGDFDAAAYLLAGENQASPVSAKKAKVVDDSDYDPAQYLLDEYDFSGKTEETKTKAKKIKTAVSTGKPAAETLLAIAFDLKGVNIFSGSVTNMGVQSRADLTENADYGISIAAERYGYISRYAAVGLGIGYEFSRCLEESPGRFSFIPLYAAFKMRVFTQEDYYLYAVAHLGYNFITANSDYLGIADSEGGIYYAGGVGASYNRYVFQILYSVNNAHLFSGSSSVSRVDKDVMYSKVGFYIGYLL